MHGQTNPEDEVVAEWYENFYDCLECGTSWTDEWSCKCDDRCPKCYAATVPTKSVDLSQPLTDEDYAGAADLMRSLAERPFNVSARDAKNYAEAMLEGGSYRFEPDTTITTEATSKLVARLTRRG